MYSTVKIVVSLCWLHCVDKKSLLYNVVVLIRDVVYFRVFIIEKCFKMFNEDSVQILTQRSWFQSFYPDDPIMRLDAHQCQEAEQVKVATVRTSWQHVWTLFRVREDSNFPSQTQSRKAACTRLDARATPSGRQDP